MTSLRRIERLEKAYSPEKRPAVPGYGRTIFVTLEEFRFIRAVKTKCQQLDPADAEVLAHAYYVLMGRRLSQNGDDGPSNANHVSER
jgi:hypothetical protein